MNAQTPRHRRKSRNLYRVSGVLGVRERPEGFTENVEGRKKTPILRFISQAYVCGQAVLKIRDDDREYLYLDQHEKEILVLEKETLPPTLNDWYLEFRKRKHLANKKVDPLDIVEIQGRHLDPQEGDYVLISGMWLPDEQGNIEQTDWPEVGVLKEISEMRFESDEEHDEHVSFSYEVDVVTLKDKMETRVLSGGFLDVVHSASGQHRRKSKGFFGKLFGKN